jgi:hypothetical protein
MVVVPIGSGMPVASQRLAPDATPVTPFEVCHVTCVIPAPPEAVPLTDMAAALLVITADAGDTMAKAMGDPAAVDGCCMLTVVVWVASRSVASKPVTVIMFFPVIKGMSLVVHVPDAIPGVLTVAAPLYP